MQPVLSIDLAAYLHSLTPRERWKLCRMILIRLDTRRMTLH